MAYGFIEDIAFTEVVEEYFVTLENYIEFQIFLTENPERGKVIPGTSALRKVRWHDPRRGKGKRGGLRIIYFILPEQKMIALLDVYDKDEAEDISKAEKKLLSGYAEKIRQDIRQRGGWTP